MSGGVGRFSPELGDSAMIGADVRPAILEGSTEQRMIQHPWGVFETSKLAFRIPTIGL